MEFIYKLLGLHKNPNPIINEMANTLKESLGITQPMAINNEPGTSRIKNGVIYLMDVDRDELDELAKNEKEVMEYE